MSVHRARLCMGVAAMLLALTGCRGSFSVQAGSAEGTPSTAAPGTAVARSQVSFGADSALGAAILLGIIAAGGMRPDSGPAGRGTTRMEDVPASGTGRHELDPSRSIRVQDCSQPVNPEGGNLICR